MNCFVCWVQWLLGNSKQSGQEACCDDRGKACLHKTPLSMCTCNLAACQHRQHHLTDLVVAKAGLQCQCGEHAIIERMRVARSDIDMITAI